MPLRSMTAYGSNRAETDQFTYSCEIKSLNTRFIEVFVRAPRDVICVESKVIQLAKTKLQRGKVDIFLDVRPKVAIEGLPVAKVDAVRHYLDQYRVIADSLGAQGDDRGLRPTDLWRMDGVLESNTKDSNDDADAIHWPVIEGLVSGAIDKLITMRETEGQNLTVALSDIVDKIESSHNELNEKRHVVTEASRNYLETRLEQISEQAAKNLAAQGMEWSAERAHMEISLLLDKSDIEEEISRIASHIQEFRKGLQADGPIGRRLDFLCQEFHREVNTVSSKLNQTEVSSLTLNMKQLVEQLRQQVQNIE